MHDTLPTVPKHCVALSLSCLRQVALHAGQVLAKLILGDCTTLMLPVELWLGDIPLQQPCCHMVSPATSVVASVCLRLQISAATWRLLMMMCQLKVPRVCAPEVLHPLVHHRHVFSRAAQSPPGLSDQQSRCAPCVAERPACRHMCSHLLARTLGLCWRPLCEQPACADCPAQPKPLPLPAGTCCGLVASAWCPAWTGTSRQSHSVCPSLQLSQRPAQVQGRHGNIISSAQVDANHCRPALTALTCGSTSSGKESSSAWLAPS